MISVKDSLILGCAFREIALQNKSGISVASSQFREIEMDSFHLSLLEKYLEDVRLDEFFKEVEV